MELKNKSIHFVGIGGVGMCGLAELLHNLGSSVTGSDIEKSKYVDHLLEMGIPIHIGHSQDHLSKTVDVVVYSSAISQDNPELKEASRRGLPVIRRAQALAEMMRLKKGVVVAGTHGKTTTTALLASVFSHADRDPTVVAGGRLDLFQSSARLGNSKWFIAESDESDGSFLHLFPELVVLTNLDEDHLDFYGSLLELKKSFRKFLGKVPFYGSIIACGDCPNVREIIDDQISSKVWLYGYSSQNDFVLKKTGKDHVVFFKNKKWATLKTPLIGDYNVLNCLATLVCSWQAGIDKTTVLSGLAEFQGVDRRMEWKGECSGVKFYDDYAHHPTEVEAVLAGLKDHFPNQRKIVLFQPHRYTRFKATWDKFLKSFDQCDVLFVTPIYGANESLQKDISSENFCKQIQHKNCQFIHEHEVIKKIPQELKKKDIFISLGAGSVNKLGDAVFSAFKSQQLLSSKRV